MKEKEWGIKKWESWQEVGERVSLFILGHILKDNTLLSDWLPRPVAGQITQPFFTKGEVFGTAAKIVALRRGSKVCFTLSLLRLRFRRARPLTDLHLKFSVCLSQNYEAFFDAREDNAVYAFLGLTAPPGSKVNLRTQTHTCPFSEQHSYSLTTFPVTPAYVPKHIFILTVWFPYRKHTYYVIHLLMSAFFCLPSATTGTAGSCASSHSNRGVFLCAVAEDI